VNVNYKLESGHIMAEVRAYGRELDAADKYGLALIIRPNDNEPNVDIPQVWFANNVTTMDMYTTAVLCLGHSKDWNYDDDRREFTAVFDVTGILKAWGFTMTRLPRWVERKPLTPVVPYAMSERKFQQDMAEWLLKGGKR
jgi:hypothetical protein